MDYSSGRMSSITNSVTGPTLNWTHYAHRLTYTKADVLHILDCDYPDQVVNGDAEVIAASSPMDVEQTGVDADMCFTQALIANLRRVSDGTVTAANLHGRLMRGTHGMNLRGTPFYAERWRRKSCVLQRMQGHGQLDKGKLHAPIGDDATRILVGVTLHETISLDEIYELKYWLREQLPADANLPDVRIELSGLWNRFTKYIQLTIPVEVWTQLPSDSAWVYVAMVKSGNRLIEGRSM
jgi:hypothetical protein